MPKLFFIYIGKNFPKWGYESLILNYKFSKAEIKLFINNDCEFNENFLPSEIEVITIEDIINDFTKKKYNHKNFFWEITSVRFKILYQIVKKKYFNEFYLSELDNLSFNLNKIVYDFKDLFLVPKISNELAIGSLIYIRGHECLKILNNSIKESKLDKSYNDMKILSDCFYQSNNFKSFFNESFFKKNKNYNFLNFDQKIYDGASIGQYLFGIDNNFIFGPNFNLKINKHSTFGNLKPKFHIQNFKIYMEISKKTYEIANIHFHNKYFYYMHNFHDLNNLFDSVNNNKKILINYGLNYKRILKFP